jgi:PAS domain-containing protein
MFYDTFKADEDLQTEYNELKESIQDLEDDIKSEKGITEDLKAEKSALLKEQRQRFQELNAERWVKLFLDKPMEALANCTRHNRVWVVQDQISDGRSLFVGSADAGGVEAQKQKVAQEKEKEQCRTILRCCPLPIYMMTSNGKYTFANDAYLLLEGLRRGVSGETGKKLEYGPLRNLKDHPDPAKRVPGRVESRAVCRDEVMTEKIQVEHEEDFTISTPDGHQLFDAEKFKAVERPVTLMSGLPGTITYFVTDRSRAAPAPAPAPMWFGRDQL